jgi:hypothetical protein
MHCVCTLQLTTTASLLCFTRGQLRLYLGLRFLFFEILLLGVPLKHKCMHAWVANFKKKERKEL